MANPNQDKRHIGILKTQLGEDVLLLRSFTAREEISRLFQIDLDLYSEDNEINFDDIVGQNVTIRMELPEGGTRYWNGYISQFVQGVSSSPQFAQYRATMVPWLWLLTLTTDSRIFQEMTVPDIVKQVFSDFGFSDIEDRLSGGYRTWEYCVQYQESAFNFVSRLMEQEGIYYYFLHEEGKCTIVLCDSRSKHDVFEYYEKIALAADTKASSQQERVTQWSHEKKLLTGKFAHTDYNPLKPMTDLMSTHEDQKPNAESGYEVYEYPGEYDEKSDGDRYAQLRMEALAYPHEVCSGKSDARGICPGYRFTLEKHDRKDQNREYLILSTTYQASAADYETGGGLEDMCRCTFTVIPATVQFRPQRITPKPRINGTQTAVVTGPSGEEIWTDEHGRVKVQFHWDRLGQYDDNTTRWIRVGQNIAGNRWGGMVIPRIGQEVMVDFIEGDPDRPIIRGVVYHGANRPPYDLPAEKTKSTFKSNSSIGGGGFNELRFEDKKGEEQIFMHAEKNQDTRVKNDCFEWVGRDRHLIVKRYQKEEVESNRHEKVGADHYEEIGKDRHLKVKGKEAKWVEGSSSLTVKGDVIDVFKANHSEQVSGDYYVKGDVVVIEGMSNVTIKVGGSYIAIESSGIKIGTSGKIELDAMDTTVKGNGQVTIQGGMVRIN